jgi:hypothetical protein
MLPEHLHRSTFHQSLEILLIELEGVNIKRLTNADNLAVLLQAIQSHAYRSTSGEMFTRPVTFFGSIQVKICMGVNTMRLSWILCTLSRLGDPRFFISLQLITLNQTILEFTIDLPARCSPRRMQGTSCGKVSVEMKPVDKTLRTTEMLLHKK